MARILLAEDDDSMRGFLAVALRRAGHQVNPAADGVAAFEAMVQAPTAGQYDLLLADIVMPGMDGIELARRATELSPRLKVMFITGFAAMALSHKPFRGHRTEVLSKPFHLRELVDNVNRLLAA